jgi:hypothetical protein
MHRVTTAFNWTNLRLRFQYTLHHNLHLQSASKGLPPWPLKVVDRSGLLCTSWSPALVFQIRPSPFKLPSFASTYREIYAIFLI